MGQLGPKQQDWMRSYGIYLHRRRLEILRKLVSKNEYTSVLDVGCGTGLLPSVGLGWTVGMDIERTEGVTVLASAEKLPFCSACFDLVVAGEIIEHLEKPMTALREWARVLKLEGALIMSTPNGGLVKARWNPRHKRTYSPRDLKRTLHRLGFRVVSAHGVFTGLFSGRRLFNLVPLEGLKTFLMRLPVPLFMSYDVFIKAKKKA